MQKIFDSVHQNENYVSLIVSTLISLSLYSKRIFCFAYMVEGASGFGTPVALGAPMLISTGHPKFESVIVLLIFNTFATVWGAGKSVEEV
jgi:L-lactate permease